MGSFSSVATKSASLLTLFARVDSVAAPHLTDCVPDLSGGGLARAVRKDLHGVCHSAVLCVAREDEVLGDVTKGIQSLEHGVLVVGVVEVVDMLHLGTARHDPVSRGR
jgi:hypothetical protein